MSKHTSTKKGATKPVVADCDSLVRFAELLKLRTLAASTQVEYLRSLRKLAARVKRDPAELDEAQVRAHLLHLKDAHHYSPSSMRTAVARLFAVIREERFIVILRLIYACGLRIGEAVTLEVGDLRGGERVHVRAAVAKRNQDRYMPLPPAMAEELRAWWKTHRHPRWIFPGGGRGWRDGSSSTATLAQAIEPMGVGSIPHCCFAPPSATRASSRRTTRA